MVLFADGVLLGSTECPRNFRLSEGVLDFDSSYGVSSRRQGVWQEETMKLWHFCSRRGRGEVLK